MIYVFALLGLDIALALTPLAIAAAMFAQTRFIFQGWLGQILNYIFLIVIVSIIIGVVLALNTAALDNITGALAVKAADGTVAVTAANGAPVQFADTNSVLIACMNTIIIYILGTLFFFEAPKISAAIFGGAASGGHNFMAVALNRVLSGGRGGGGRPPLPPAPRGGGSISRGR